MAEAKSRPASLSAIIDILKRTRRDITAEPTRPHLLNQEDKQEGENFIEEVVSSVLLLLYLNSSKKHLFVFFQEFVSFHTPNEAEAERSHVV